MASQSASIRYQRLLQLQECRQKSRSFTEYFAEFEALAQNSGLDDSTLYKYLVNGMSRELQNVAQTISPDRENWRALAVELKRRGDRTGAGSSARPSQLQNRNRPWTTASAGEEGGRPVPASASTSTCLSHTLSRSSSGPRSRPIATSDRGSKDSSRGSHPTSTSDRDVRGSPRGSHPIATSDRGIRGSPRGSHPIATSDRDVRDSPRGSHPIAASSRGSHPIAVSNRGSDDSPRVSLRSHRIASNNCSDDIP